MNWEIFSCKFYNANTPDSTVVHLKAFLFFCHFININRQLVIKCYSQNAISSSFYLLSCWSEKNKTIRKIVKFIKMITYYDVRIHPYLFVSFDGMYRYISRSDKLPFTTTITDKFFFFFLQFMLNAPYTNDAETHTWKDPDDFWSCHWQCLHFRRSIDARIHTHTRCSVECEMYCYNINEKPSMPF